MKHTFAKIIELEGHQVLVVKGWDLETKKDTVSVTTRFDGVTPSLTLGFDSEAAADKYLTEYGPEQAQAFVNEMAELMA